MSVKGATVKYSEEHGSMNHTNNYITEWNRALHNRMHISWNIWCIPPEYIHSAKLNTYKPFILNKYAAIPQGYIQCNITSALVLPRGGCPMLYFAHCTWTARIDGTGWTRRLRYIRHVEVNSQHCTCWWPGTVRCYDICRHSADTDQFALIQPIFTFRVWNGRPCLLVRIFRQGGILCINKQMYLSAVYSNIRNKWNVGIQ